MQRDATRRGTSRMTVQGPPVSQPSKTHTLAFAVIFEDHEAILSPQHFSPPNNEYTPASIHPQAHLNFGAELPTRHTDLSKFTVQHSYDNRSPDNLSLQQTGADGGEGKSPSKKVYPEVPPGVCQHSKMSKEVHVIGSSLDQAMYKLSVSHLRPLALPPLLDTLSPLPPALPSPVLSPLPNLAFANMLRPPTFLNTRTLSLQDQQSQSLAGTVITIGYPEPQGSEYTPSLDSAQKTSTERERSSNPCAGLKGQWSARLYRPIMEYTRQQAIPKHRVSALQETDHSRSINRTSESSGSLSTSDSFGSQTRPQLLPMTADDGKDIKRCQGTPDAEKGTPPDEATAPDVPTKSRKQKRLWAAGRLVNWDVLSCRGTPQPPLPFERNNDGGIECDDYQTAHSTAPLRPLQALLMEFYPDLLTSNEPPLKVELAWVRRAVFAAAFESNRRRMERGDMQYSGGIIPPHLTQAVLKSLPLMSSPLRAPPDTHQDLEENPSPHEKPNTSARPPPASLSPSTISTVSSGNKPDVTLRLRAPGSLAVCTNSPPRSELEDHKGHKRTTGVSIETGKHTHRKLVSQMVQNSDSILSDPSLSFLGPTPQSAVSLTPPTLLPARCRARPRKKPMSIQSAPGGRTLLSRRRLPHQDVAGVPSTATTTTGLSCSGRFTPTITNTSSTIDPLQREVNQGRVNHISTSRGSETLASIFDGDLSDLEEELVSQSQSRAVLDNALPEAFSNIHLNTTWRTLAPVKVPRRHLERLAAALKELRREACAAVHTTTSNAVRNAVLARAKKVGEGGISGYASSSNANLRPHEDQDVADAEAETRRTLVLLALIRSPPEKTQSETSK